MIQAGSWTVVAESPAPGEWKFRAGYDRKTVIAAVDAGEYIVMHKRTGRAEFQLLARMTCPAWRKIRRALADRPLEFRGLGR